METLQQELSDLRGTDPDYAQSFRALAERLFGEAVLIVGDKSYYLVELELYLDPDPYIHADARQIDTTGKWYFHRQNGKGYKGGTFKGVDLTCGPVGVGGGILVRAVVDADTGDFTEGPCKVVDLILAETGYPSVQSLARALPGGEDAPDAFSAWGPFRLDLDSPQEFGTAVCAPRVGLSNKYPPYRDLPLRLLTRPRETRKEKGAILRALVSQVGLARAAEIVGKTPRALERYRAPQPNTIPDDDPLWEELGL